MQTERSSFGTAAESYVCRYLEQQGYKVLARNYRIVQGELDIVARRDNLLVCVEVKARRALYFPISSVVTPSKQKKFIRAARSYIHIHRLFNVAVRFDVALVYCKNDSTWELTYIPRAFDAESDL